MYVLLWLLVLLLPLSLQAMAVACAKSLNASSTMPYSCRTWARTTRARRLAVDMRNKGSFCSTEMTDDKHRSFSSNVVAVSRDKHKQTKVVCERGRNIKIHQKM